MGGTAIRLDSDGFHNVREIRYRQGRGSARGYYEDAYDFDALAERVLVPLGAGRLEYAPKVHDLETDEICAEASAVASPDAIVVFDCTFLQRGGLRDLWDEVIFLSTSIAAAQSRGIARDAARMGGADAARANYDARYMAACRIYLAEEDPVNRASIVIDNEDVAAPRVLRGLD
jgi:uridine kinase